MALLIGGAIGGLHTEEPFLAYWLDLCPAARFHYECAYPGWLDWLAGLAGGALLGVIAWLADAIAGRCGRPAVTVFCRGCDGMGWIADLGRAGGHCPRCGHGRFDYRIVEFGGKHNPVRIRWERDLSALDLLQRWERTRERFIAWRRDV